MAGQSDSETTEETLTWEQAAARACCSLATLRRLALSDPKFPAVRKLGRLARINASAFRAWLAGDAPASVKPASV